MHPTFPDESSPNTPFPIDGEKKVIKQGILTKLEIENAMHLSQQQAAARYGCCVSTVKRAFKKYFQGQRWPSTKRRSDIKKHRSSMKKRMQALVDELEEDFTESELALLAVSHPQFSHQKHRLSINSRSTARNATPTSAGGYSNSVLTPDYSHPAPIIVPHPVGGGSQPPSAGSQSFSPMNSSALTSAMVLRNTMRDSPLSTTSSGMSAFTSFPQVSEQAATPHLQRAQPSQSSFTAGVSPNMIRSSPGINSHLPVPSPVSTASTPMSAPVPTPFRRSQGKRRDSTSSDSQQSAKTSPDGSIKSLLKENLKLKKLLLEKESKIESMLKQEEKKRKATAQTNNDTSEMVIDEEPVTAYSGAPNYQNLRQQQQQDEDPTCLRSMGYLGNIYKLDGPWKDIPVNAQKNRVVVLCDFELNVVACSYPFIEVTQYTFQELQAGFSLFRLLFPFTNKELVTHNNKQFLKEASVNKVQFTDTWFRKDKSMVLFEVQLRKHHGLLWITCLPATSRKQTVTIDDGKEVIQKVFTADTQDQDEDRLDSLYVDHTCVLFHLHEYLESLRTKNETENAPTESVAVKAESTSYETSADPAIEGGD